MPIMRDIKLTLGTAILAGLMVTTAPVLGQDATAEASADNDKPTTTQVVQARDSVPESTLQFRRARLPGNTELTEITPSIVQQFARLGQFKAPRVRENEVVSLGLFEQKLLVERQRNNQAGLFIGVVVDTSDPYTPLLPGYTGRDHFRAVHKRVVELMTGYRHVDTGIIPNVGLGTKPDESTKVKGFAELYGAEVQGIIPIKYVPGSTMTGPDGTKVPIRRNDIILLDNDHPYAFESEAPHHLINDLDELESHLQDHLERDMHLYSFNEFHPNRDVILANARKKYGPLVSEPLFATKTVTGSTDRASGSGDESSSSDGSGDKKAEITSLAMSNE